MAYATSQTESQRIVTIGIVLLVHVALAALLVTEFAPQLIPQILPPPRHPIIDFTPKPKPPPPPTAKPDDTLKPHPNDTVTAPERPIDIVTAGPIVPIAPFTPIVIDPIVPTSTSSGDSLGSIYTPKGPSPLNPPSSWATNNDYPSVSLRFEEHGISKFRVSVGTDGRVKACEIVKSSGSRRLDDAACRLVTSRARFEPATDRYGEKVVGTYSNAVSWELPD
jgi:protein TonB